MQHQCCRRRNQQKLEQGEHVQANVRENPLEIDLSQCTSGDNHGQRDAGVRHVGNAFYRDFRKVDREQHENHCQQDTDDSRVNEILEPEWGFVPGHSLEHLNGIGIEEKVESQRIERDVERFLRAVKGLNQRDAHERRIGEDQHDGHQFPVVPLHPQEFRHHRPQKNHQSIEQRHENQVLRHQIFGNGSGSAEGGGNHQQWVKNIDDEVRNFRRSLLGEPSLSKAEKAHKNKTKEKHELLKND